MKFANIDIIKVIGTEDYCISQEEYIKKIASNEDSIEIYPYRQTFKSDQGGNGKLIQEATYKDIVMQLMHVATKTQPDILLASVKSSVVGFCLVTSTDVAKRMS